MKHLIDKHTGIVNLSPKQGEKQSPKQLNLKKQQEIDICLNCDKRRCKGNCEKIRSLDERSNR